MSIGEEVHVQGLAATTPVVMTRPSTEVRIFRVLSTGKVGEARIGPFQPIHVLLANVHGRPPLYTTPGIEMSTVIVTSKWCCIISETLVELNLNCTITCSTYVYYA